MLMTGGICTLAAAQRMSFQVRSDTATTADGTGGLRGVQREVQSRTGEGFGFRELRIRGFMSQPLSQACVKPAWKVQSRIESFKPSQLLLPRSKLVPVTELQLSMYMHWADVRSHIGISSSALMTSLGGGAGTS